MLLGVFRSLLVLELSSVFCCRVAYVKMGYEPGGSSRDERDEGNTSFCFDFTFDS